MAMGAVADLNKFASLGALTVEHGNIYIGSRLTIYEGLNTWDTLHLPLLLLTTICATDAILGAVDRAMRRQQSCGGNSEWNESDFRQAHEMT